MEIITSRQNPRFKEIKKLTEDKKYRTETRSFFVDGVNFVAQAIENNWEIEQLVYVPSEIDSDFKKKVIAQVPAEKHFQIDITLYESLSTKNDIQGVGAVVKQKAERNVILGSTGVVLENISNPGNLGSIMRLCAAFGVKSVYTVLPAVELFNPEVVRSSMGAIFHLRLVEFESLQLMKHKLSENGHHCIGTSIQDDSIDIGTYKIKDTDNEKVLIWFGNEARGLTNEARDMCQTLVRIPMSSIVDSLNIAESAAIVVYELLIRNNPHPPR